MSDEALIQEEEKDIIDILSTQGQEVDEEEVEGLPTELPDDPDELKQLVADYQERVSKRNKTIKKRSDATHRMQEEIEALKSQVETYQSQSTQASTAEAQKQEQEKAYAEWRDSVSDDPSKAVDFATWQAGQMQDRMVDYIAKMQSSLEGQIAALKGEMNPEKQKYRDKIATLKQNPDFSDLDDDTAIKFIRATEQIKLGPRGTIGGKPVPTQKTREKRLDELRKRAKEHMQNGLG